MDPEDLTSLDVVEDPTPAMAYAFGLMSTLFNKKVAALKAASHQVIQLTPIAAQLLASALLEVLEVGHDLHALLTGYTSYPGSPANQLRTDPSPDTYSTLTTTPIRP